MLFRFMNLKNPVGHTEIHLLLGFTEALLVYIYCVANAFSIS